MSNVSISRGMTVTSGVVTITKDDSNLIGISIGGGAPLCPCLYIVQVFDNTATARDGTLEAGDEIVGVAGVPVKGKSKVEVAKMIQAGLPLSGLVPLRKSCQKLSSPSFPMINCLYAGLSRHRDRQVQQAARRPEAGEDAGPGPQKVQAQGLFLVLRYSMVT